METSIVNYESKPILFLKLPGNDLLLKTTDICNVLGIVDRPANSALARPCLDLASAVNLALAQDEDFGMWLTETFAGYNLETLVHPVCDDDWNFR